MPTVMISETLTGESPRPLVTKRETNQPVAGATTPSTRKSANHSGSSWRTLKSQKMKEKIIAKAPCARLKTRVVV